MNQDWFEMRDIRRRKFNSAVWSSVRASQLESVGEFRTQGHREEFFGAGSIAVPLVKRSKVEALGWTDIGLSHMHRATITKGRYIPSDIFDGGGQKLGAVALTLAQDGNDEDLPEWHLHKTLLST